MMNLTVSLILLKKNAPKQYPNGRDRPGYSLPLCCNPKRLISHSHRLVKIIDQVFPANSHIQADADKDVKT